MSDRDDEKRPTARQLVRLLRRMLPVGLVRRGGAVTLSELENSGRPLLFSRLPRMLRGDGTAPASVQATFEYVDRDRVTESAVTVSPQRWRRALEISRRLAARRSARGRR